MITLRRIFGVLTLLVLAACGGGGGGGGSSATADYQIEGVAATGAAMVGATISVEDSKGKSYNCVNKTGTDGKYSCTVSGSAVPPFLLKAQIGTDDSTALNSVVIEATAGKTATAHITPLSNALLQIDLAYLNADSTTPAQAIQRVKDRKKQITDALSNVITEAGLTSASFDFLTDSSFAANTGAGMDRLLDNISVKNTSTSSSTTTVEIALKNTTDKATLSSTDTDLTNTAKKVTSKDSNAIQIVNPVKPTRSQSDFQGTYTVNTTFYSNNGDGSFVPPQTKTAIFKVASDYTITCTDTLAGCSGSLTFDKNNVPTFTIKNGNTTLSGSIDSSFKVTATLNSQSTNADKTVNTSSGKVFGWKKNGNQTDLITNYQGTYNISLPTVVYRDGSTGDIATPSNTQLNPSNVSGTISIGADGKVTTCNIGTLKNCTGGLILKHKDQGGASFVISANDASSTSDADLLKATFWGTFAGSVDTSKSVSGSLTAKIKDGYKVSGDFTGSLQAVQP